MARTRAALSQMAAVMAKTTFAETAAWTPSEAPMDTVGAGEVTTR